jgi:hypothetical protein
VRGMREWEKEKEKGEKEVLTDIRDMLQHGRIRRNTNEKLKLAIRRPTPQEDDENRKYHGAHGI